MAKGKTRPVARPARKTKAERQEERDREQHYWHGRGISEGEKLAEEAYAKDLADARGKTNLELARALASMIESTARAVITFIGEGGVRS